MKATESKSMALKLSRKRELLMPSSRRLRLRSRFMCFGKLTTVNSGSGSTAYWNWLVALYDPITGLYSDGRAVDKSPVRILQGHNASAGSYGRIFEIANNGTSGAPLALAFDPVITTPPFARITANSGSFSAWTYTVTYPDGSTASAYNAFEWNGTTPGMIAGSPGSLGINVATTGTVTGTSCVVKPIGNGGFIPVYTVNGRLTFAAPNSAQ